MAVTSTPFKKPMKAPNSSTPTRMATTGWNPALTISCAVSAPERAMIELTLRSMPPSRMAKNSPRPSRMVIELCSITLTRLPPVKKVVGRRIPNTTTMIARIVIVL